MLTSLNQQALQPPKLSEHARGLGLDGARFDQCLTSGTHAARVSQGLTDGQAAGVQGTPGSVVSKTTPGDTVEGTLVVGAQPVEIFLRLIDQLLAEKERAAGPEWLNTPTFTDVFSEWLKRVRDQKHVFLAYSSGVAALANHVNRFLTEHLNLSVLDWQALPASRVVMDNIVKAERQTMFGVFLLTKDDKGIDKGSVRRAVPRDNVVFEAGYFAGAKGPQFDLIIHEPGAKLPTDLGGFVYLEWKKGSGIASIETKIRDYFAQHFPK